MKLINIPPYRGDNYTTEKGHFLVQQILDRMRRRGQLEGVEIDVDDGYPLEYSPETHVKAYVYKEWGLANITVGFLQRVKEISDMGKYDAIVTSGSIEPGFFAGRLISKIPIAFSLHSAVHIASLLGDRSSMIELGDQNARIVRRQVELYGLGHKLVSARCVPYSAHDVMTLITKYAEEERTSAPEVNKVLNNVVAQCMAAIEKDRADCLILGCPPLQCLEEEIRQRLDAAGYDEIQLVCELPAAVECARAMVNLKLTQAPRAYPSDLLKAKPEFR